MTTSHRLAARRTTAAATALLAGLLTVPRFLPAAGPVGMRSRALMKVAVRCMGNLVTEADSDLVARTWRTAGTTSLKIDSRPPFS